ncbi:(d)CMP kinase [Candidatus Dependentiae bacterium]|nr:(d)CMP kinase [Candidatus Dependentiae bacterium]
MIITIDGPVASGKSSVARALARELKSYYLYTGLLYRAVAHVLLDRLKKEKTRRPFLPEFQEYVEELGPDQLEFVSDLCYDYGKDDDGDRPYLFYLGEEITHDLYSSELDQPASIVSANKHVRDALLDLQRDVAKRYDIVADGRDCGTVIFPQAEHKFYLTASPEVRAQRLMLDEKRGPLQKDIEKVEAELEQRDKRDRERSVAPLTIPEDATIIDNSELTLQETVNRFLRAIGS